MTVQASTTVRNAKLDAVETAIGTDAKLKIFTGSQPANCAASNSGSLLASLSLPTDYLAAAASGSKAKSGSWSDASADGSGDAGHWRLYATDGTTCHLQGSCSATGDGGDMELDTITLVATQQFTITGFTMNEGNA